VSYQFIYDLHRERERRITELAEYCKRNSIYSKVEIKDIAKRRYNVNEQTARDYAQTVQLMLLA